MTTGFQLAKIAIGLSLAFLSQGIAAAEFRDCLTCPQMLEIPGGTFVMGSPLSEPGRFEFESPQHSVQVPVFGLSKYAITFDQWDACFADGGGLRSAMRSMHVPDLRTNFAGFRVAKTLN